MDGRVSFHAIVRFLERVESLDLSVLDGPLWPDDAAKAKAACEILGLTIEAVSARICPPYLHAALDFGACRILRHNYSLVCVDGVVVTVVDGRYGQRYGHGSCVRQREGVTRRGGRRARRDQRAIVEGWEDRA